MSDENPIAEVAEHLPDAGINPAHGIAGIALSMALRWHDTGVVKDGAMYQQLRVEGKEIRPMDVHDVLDTAKLFEKHLMDAPNRLSAMVFDVIEQVLLGEEVPNHVE